MTDNRNDTSIDCPFAVNYKSVVFYSTSSGCTKKLYTESLTARSLEIKGILRHYNVCLALQHFQTELLYENEKL